jgi:hypothetical protein
MFTIGQRVNTEYGTGTVTHLSGRRIVVALDSNEAINVAVGTPGFYRITPAS